MKRRISSGIIFGAFIIILCFPWLLWILSGKFVDSSNYENRELAMQPELTLDNYGTFSQEFDLYFNDHIPFRNNLITINSAIDYFIFNKSISDYVIVGDDNWLFYSRADDGDSVSCYQGTNLLSEEELEHIAHNCMEQREFLAQQGVEFVIFIAPNKERIYYDKMPEKYGSPSHSYRVRQIVDYLKANTDVRVVYPYEELMQAKELIDENIYYKTDTHWNNIGGYVGTVALMEELGIEMPSIDDEQISIVCGDNIAGDLSAMLNLSKELAFSDVEYYVEGYDTHNVQVVEEDFLNAYAYHAENADPRKIYVRRDSFSSAMRTYIGSQFSDSYLRYSGSYSYEDYRTQNPDIYVYETVERYVGELKDFSVQ